ncbi:recQ-mediated genome instability protein 1-like [Ochlerotatus camptorhynchus]|uniref:recQ-mediated genome instability protein 1-like n=1 Tax=Ochlerotatus camptorhynchus TaxID=644619 RepID=UPI0031D2CC3E
MTQTETNRAVHVKTRLLRDYSIKVVDEWLTGCVSFCLQENSKTTNDSLLKFTFDQWILADLKEIGVSCLPAIVDTETKCFTLNGNFPLQLNYLMDISEPCYDQLRNLYNKKLDEADDEIQMRKNQTQNVKKRRMLKLEMTDGKRTVIGMEHSPIAALNTKLPPGVKVLLTGPIRCINKVLFLEPKNVKILGGEVDTLLITNAFENMLLKELGQPLNPSPKTEYEEVVVSEKNNRNTGYNNIPSVPMVFPSPAKPMSSRSSNNQYDDWEDDMFLGINLDGIESNGHLNRNNKDKPPEQVPTVSTLMDDDDDLEIIELSEEEIMNHQVSSTKTSQPSPPQRRSKRPTYRLPSFEEPDDDIDALNSLEDEIRNEQQNRPGPIIDYDEPELISSSPVAPVQQAKRVRINEPAGRSSNASNFVNDGQQPSTSKNFDNCSLSALFEDDSLDDVFDVEEKQPSSSEKDNVLSPRYQFQIEGYSLVTVDQISKLSDGDRDERTFVVFGEVEEVFERIRISDDGWKLGVMVTDRSERVLPVRFHTAVISKMVGHEASEIQQMKRAKNPQVMKLLEEILIKFKNQLQDLRTFMRVRYHQGNDFPTIMELYECTRSRLTVLTNKINQENLKHLLEILPQDCDPRPGR